MRARRTFEVEYDLHGNGGNRWIIQRRRPAVVQNASGPFIDRLKKDIIKIFTTMDPEL